MHTKRMVQHPKILVFKLVIWIPMMLAIVALWGLGAWAGRPAIWDTRAVLPREACAMRETPAGTQVGKLRTAQRVTVGPRNGTWVLVAYEDTRGRHTGWIEDKCL